MGENPKYEIGKVEVLLAWKCNSNCVFCSVGHKFREGKVKSWEKVKKHIDYGKEVKSETISFSGGEPTILNYLEKAVKYAKNLGFKTIEIQSNGRMFYYKDFAEKIVNAGANRFLISLHADNPETGDALSRYKGSFEQTVQGIKNLKALGVENLRFSTVITRMNYRDLPRIMEFLLAFDPIGIHVNYVIIDGNAYELRDVIMPPKMSEVAQYVHEAIKIVKKAGKEIWIYSFPFCLLHGYEFVVADMGSKDSKLFGPDFVVSLQENRHKHRVKSKSCKACRYDPICLGVWRRYAKIFGLDELRPVHGERVTDIGTLYKQDYKF